MSTLYTVGYEGSSIDAVLATLLDAKIDILIDVRDVPISRKKGFSKSSLSAYLAGVGIEYRHLKGLGDPKAGRIAARAGDYPEFRRIFTSHLRTKVAGVDLVLAIEAARRGNACLLCFERDPANCHRNIVGETMARAGNFHMKHLMVASNSVVESIRREKYQAYGACSVVG